MRVMTILGTRPEIIRLSAVVGRLDALVDHVLVHTGQNFDPALSDVFFDELGVRRPDHRLEARGGALGARLGRILEETGALLESERPDRLLVLGDTDSGLSALVARRLGIPVFHMEAGNRCFDDRVPEEVNRRVIDHASDVWLPYTERSRAHLLREGCPPHRIFVTGNPIFEVLDRHRAAIDRSDVLDRLGLVPGEYFLLTAHRQENVDVADRLASLVAAVQAVARRWELPVVCSVHPRLASRLEAAGVTLADARVRVHEPFGFFDFTRLERHARCVLTDSGTVQEECCLFGVPTVTLRDTTERPETLECGSNVLAGVAADDVLRAVTAALARGSGWQPPAEYLTPHVSATVASLVVGFDGGL